MPQKKPAGAAAVTKAKPKPKVTEHEAALKQFGLYWVADMHELKVSGGVAVACSTADLATKGAQKGAQSATSSKVSAADKQAQGHFSVREEAAARVAAMKATVAARREAEYASERHSSSEPPAELEGPEVPPAMPAGVSFRRSGSLYRCVPAEPASVAVGAVEAEDAGVAAEDAAFSSEEEGEEEGDLPGGIPGGRVNMSRLRLSGRQDAKRLRRLSVALAIHQPVAPGPESSPRSWSEAAAGASQPATALPSPRGAASFLAMTAAATTTATAAILDKLQGKRPASAAASQSRQLTRQASLKHASLSRGSSSLRGAVSM